MIAKKRNKDWERVQRLIDVQERLAFNLDEMITVVMTELHEEPYTLDEVYIVVLSVTRHVESLSFVCISRRGEWISPEIVIGDLTEGDQGRSERTLRERERKPRKLRRKKKKR